MNPEQLGFRKSGLSNTADWSTDAFYLPDVPGVWLLDMDGEGWTVVTRYCADGVAFDGYTMLTHGSYESIECAHRKVLEVTPGLPTLITPPGGGILELDSQMEYNRKP